MRPRVGAAFGGGLAVAALTVGCGGRTDLTPPGASAGSAQSGASVTGSVSGSDAATSGDANEATTGTEPTSGTVFGTMSSGTLTAMSGTTAQASGTTAEASGTIETSGSVAPCSPNWFTGIGCESGSTATSGTTVATSGTVVATSGTFTGSGTVAATSGTFAGSGTLMSSSGTTTATGACGAGASSVPVSFANDLMPIFQNNCSVGGVGSGALCHADPSVTSTIAPGGTRPYFGPPAPAVSSAATPTMIYEGLVNESSSEDITMSRVAPGEPTQSYLWYKINGIESALENESPDACARGDLGTCGSPMPLPLMGFVVAVFAQSNRDLICNWITQGAPNN
jgi:hypothetical protein